MINMSLTGLLPLNKPAGMRSTACVEAARSTLGGEIKVGHGGTLDSTASGLLILLVGAATRLSGYIMDMPKCYEAVIQLGRETATDDASGESRGDYDWRYVTDTVIDNALPAFLGWRLQEPPQISAVRVGGERAHRLARGGRELPIEPKPVRINKIERLTSMSSHGRIGLKIVCGKGTYIRSLARDLGRKIGCGAHVHSLCRISSGPFRADNSFPAGELLKTNPAELQKLILPPESLCGVSTIYTADEIHRDRVVNGRPQMLSKLRRVSFGLFSGAAGRVVLTMDGVFSICAARPHGSSIELRPEVNIFYGGREVR